MARWSWSVFLGFIVPLLLLVVNLVWGYGGILALILLFIWVGMAVVLVLPEETV
ncbi:MAG: hypothetical protein AABX97_00370 [Candidatus Thermoplasmatota archaeon]